MQNSKEKYNVGQILTVEEDIQLKTLILEEEKTIKAGTKAYVGVDGFLHYLDGTIEVPKKEIEGFAVKGIADWLYELLSRNLSIDEYLDDYDISGKEFKDCIADALEELGMYDNTGNRR